MDEGDVPFQGRYCKCGCAETKKPRQACPHCKAVWPENLRERSPYDGGPKIFTFRESEGYPPPKDEVVCVRCNEHEGLFRHGVKKGHARTGDSQGLIFETNHVRCCVQPGPSSDLWEDDLKKGESYYVEIGIYRPNPPRLLTALYADYMDDPRHLTAEERERLMDAFTRLDELEQD